MTAESWPAGKPMAEEIVAAFAGSLVGAEIVGPENEDGRIIDAYPLTPLRWRAAKTLASAVQPECWARFTGESTLPPQYDPNSPKPGQFADTGISSVSFESLVSPDEYDGVPVVFWPYGGRLVVGRIPDRHLTDVPANSNFLWASRFAGGGRFGAGRLVDGQIVMAKNVRAVEVVPASELPPTIPSY